MTWHSMTKGFLQVGERSKPLLFVLQHTGWPSICMAAKVSHGLSWLIASEIIREALNKSQLWFDTFPVRPECRA